MNRDPRMAALIQEVQEIDPEYALKIPPWETPESLQLQLYYIRRMIARKKAAEEEIPHRKEAPM